MAKQWKIAAKNNDEELLNKLLGTYAETVGRKELMQTSHRELNESSVKKEVADYFMKKMRFEDLNDV